MSPRSRPLDNGGPMSAEDVTEVSAQLLRQWPLPPPGTDKAV